MRPLTPQRILGTCLGLCGVLFGVAVISLRMGAYPISVRDIVSTLFSAAAGRREEVPVEFWQVVFGLRLPRIALGILVGASLSTAGAGFQALLRNPLADPYVLGVSSGAALGAIVSLIVAPHTVGAIQIAARQSESLPLYAARRSSLRSLLAPRRSKPPAHTDPPEDSVAALESPHPRSRAMHPPKFPAQSAAAATQKPLARIPRELPRVSPPPH